MTDVLSICKTFIKSSLDINANSNGIERSSFNSCGWQEESSSLHSHLSSDQGIGIISGKSWSKYNYRPASQRNTQQPLTKHEQRKDSIKKSKHLRLSPSSEAAHFKSSK
ncbi:hypothetical protein GH733_004712 [Mirounga leonina]|nr:hypothetical protein GH733_004712 [Mirounga leonina]